MFRGRGFDNSVILLCVRWYLAYNLSLRDGRLGHAVSSSPEN
jgi:transposase-like protein